MSRPPRPYSGPSTTGDPVSPRSGLDYFPLDFWELVGLAREHALAHPERPLRIPDDPRDHANTLLEASALVAHILGVYQERYAAESFLGTARSLASLVRHARRLAYEPDPGVAATGHVVLWAAEGLSATIPRGFALASAPVGEAKPQHYETLGDVDVDSTRNLLPLRETTRGRTYTGHEDYVVVKGTGLAIPIGEKALIVGNDFHRAVKVTRAVPDPDVAGATRVSFDGGLGGDEIETTGQELRLLANPSMRLRPFGYNSDPLRYPPEKILEPGTAGGVSYELKITGEDEIDTQEIFLSSEVEADLNGTWTYNPQAAGRGIRQVKDGSQRVVKLSFRRSEEVAVYAPFDGTTYSTSDGEEVHLCHEIEHPVHSSISGTVTALKLETSAGVSVQRKGEPLTSTYLCGWKVEAELVTEEPNHEELAGSLKLDGHIEGLVPGALVLFASLDGTRTEPRRIIRSEQTTDATAQPITELFTEPLDPLNAETWHMDDLRVYGNVAALSHGKTTEEVLGGSDGVTPFQRFQLKDEPLTHIPGAEGALPELEVRVADVAWTRVGDLGESGPDDRHYRIERDDQGGTTVVFGDRVHGAIPPSGKKHIRAHYRVGLGAAGNVGAGVVSRIKKAHPVIERAWNPGPIGAGTDPAGPEDIRRQATRWIRTFDRAVSVSDHADLALTFPGVARAAASWSDENGVELVVATDRGECLSSYAQQELLKFLDRRRDTSIPLVLVDPVAVSIELTLEIDHDPAYLTENVKTAVREALWGEDERTPGLFTFAGRDFGQAAFKSEVFERVDAVEGVDSLRISKFCQSGSNFGAEPQDVIHAAHWQWLALDPNDLAIEASPGRFA